MTPGPRTAALQARIGLATEAIARSGDRLPPEARSVAAAALDRARDRLAFGADHTLVALAGGTGSGKSSLFNAISGLDFAGVGVRRPTTSAVTACVWAHDASGLLDWLGVDRLRRIERESVLDGDAQAALRGLVLLDLPDHDSIAREHREVVDRVLPQADLIAWVVDPQKYADETLHADYLRRLAGHSAAMIVVVNQIDTVPAGAREALIADVERLIAADGLTGVAVYPVSATTGEGIDELVHVLEAAVAGHGLAEIRADVAIGDAVRAVAAHTGTAPPPAPTAGLVAGLVEASGAPGQARALERPGSGGLAAFAGVGPTQVARVETERRAWLVRAVDGLPRPWGDGVAAAVPEAPTMAQDLDARLTGIRPVPGRGRGPTAAAITLALAVLATLAGLGATIGALLAEGGLGGTGTVLVAATAAAALTTVLLIAGLRRARRRHALARAAHVRDAAHAAAAEVAADAASAVAAVLAEHAEIVRLLERAGERPLSPSTPPTGLAGSPA